MHRSKLAFNYFLKLTALKGKVVKDPKCPKPAFLLPHRTLSEENSHILTFPCYAKSCSSGHYDLTWCTLVCPWPRTPCHQDPSQPCPGWSCSLAMAPSLSPGVAATSRNITYAKLTVFHSSSSIKGIVWEQIPEITMHRTSENKLSWGYIGIYTGKREKF